MPPWEFEEAPPSVLGQLLSAKVLLIAQFDQQMAYWLRMGLITDTSNGDVTECEHKQPDQLINAPDAAGAWPKWGGLGRLLVTGGAEPSQLN